MMNVEDFVELVTNMNEIAICYQRIMNGNSKEEMIHSVNRYGEIMHRMSDAAGDIFYFGDSISASIDDNIDFKISEYWTKEEINMAEDIAEENDMWYYEVLE